MGLICFAFSSARKLRVPRALLVVLVLLVSPSDGISSNDRRERRKTRRARRQDSGHSRPKGGWPMPLTPGQPSPGDPSYISDTCRHHVDDARTEYLGPSVIKQPDASIPPGWSNKHPNASDLELIEETVKVDGNNWCPYLTQECVEPDTVYRRFQRNKKVAGGGTFSTTFFSKEQWDELPSIPKGFFGSCAFVSLADTIVTKHGWGPIIDSHDTVMRLGHPPLKGFKKDLGTRADVLLGRGATLGKRLPPGYNPKWTLGCQFEGSNATTAKMWGHRRHVKKNDKEIGPGLIGQLYSRMVDPMVKPRGATSGIIQALGVVLSGMCTRLDIFGMSPYNGGHYFCNQGKTHSFTSFYTTTSCGKLKYTHSPGIENWLLHYIMKNFPELNICVYL